MTQEAILTRESTNADNLKNVIADIKKTLDASLRHPKAQPSVERAHLEMGDFVLNAEVEHTLDGLPESIAVAAFIEWQEERAEAILAGDPPQDLVRNIHDDDFANGAGSEDGKSRFEGILAYSLDQLANKFPDRDSPLIDNVCRIGETFNVIAKSKVGKSWLVYGMALAVTNGQPWLGHDVSKGNVLIVDNEIRKGELSHRLNLVASELQIPHDIRRGGINTMDELHDAGIRGRMARDIQ